MTERNTRKLDSETGPELGDLEAFSGSAPFTFGAAEFFVMVKEGGQSLPTPGCLTYPQALPDAVSTSKVVTTLKFLVTLPNVPGLGGCLCVCVCGACKTLLVGYGKNKSWYIYTIYSSILA